MRFLKSRTSMATAKFSSSKLTRHMSHIRFKFKTQKLIFRYGCSAHPLSPSFLLQRHLCVAFTWASVAHQNLSICRFAYHTFSFHSIALCKRCASMTINDKFNASLLLSKSNVRL